MSPDVKRARSRTRSRSPLKRTYDNKSRDGRSRGSARQVRDKESRVYVSNMNYDMKWMELKDIMKKSESFVFKWLYIIHSKCFCRKNIKPGFELI